MGKITYAALKEAFRQHERNHPKEHLIGYVVFTEDSFTQIYFLKSQTYRVSSESPSPWREWVEISMERYVE